jgi:hypothetical protein
LKNALDAGSSRGIDDGLESQAAETPCDADTHPSKPLSPRDRTTIDRGDGIVDLESTGRDVEKRGELSTSARHVGDREKYSRNLLAWRL